MLARVKGSWGSVEGSLKETKAGPQGKSDGKGGERRRGVRDDDDG